MSWLKTLTDSVEEAETPKRFYYWAGISAVAAIVNKNVWLDRHVYTLYPNLYVMLIGDSGIKKGPAVNLASKLVEMSNCTRVIKGRNSIQGIIKSLGEAKSLEGGGMIKDARAFLAAGEFSTFLLQDSIALSILMDLYDTQYHGNWKNTLKNSPVDNLKEPCVNMIGASNEAMLEDCIPKQFVKGGLVARILWIQEMDRNCVNSLVKKPNKLVDYSKLMEQINIIKKIRGPFTWTDDAAALYDQWYNTFTTVNRGNDVTGTINRITDTILKVAMNIELTNLVTEKDSLTIKVATINEAIKVCLATLPGMKRTILGTGGAQLALQTSLLLKYLLVAPDNQATRQKILSIFWGDFDAFDLDRIAETLIQARALKLVRNGYAMTKDAVEQYSKFMGVV